MDNKLYYNYLNLSEVLEGFYKNNIDNITLTLLISLGNSYYMGDNFKMIISDLQKLLKGKIIKYKDKEFKVNKLTLMVGDTLRRHVFYYNHCAEYFKKHNIDKEELIPLEIRKEFDNISYQDGLEESKEWLLKNIDGINSFSNDKKIDDSFKTNNDITTIFEETDLMQKLEYMSYNHYYNNPKYKDIENKLKVAMKISDGLINRCYDFEANTFCNRLLRRGEVIDFKDLFIQQSKKYLFDETIPVAIRMSLNNNCDIYYHSNTPLHCIIYNGKNVKNNKELNEYVLNNLNEIRQYIQVTIKEKDFHSR